MFLPDRGIGACGIATLFREMRHYDSKGVSRAQKRE